MRSAFRDTQQNFVHIGLELARDDTFFNSYLEAAPYRLVGVFALGPSEDGGSANRR